MKSGVDQALWRGCIKNGDAIQILIFLAILYVWVIPQMLPPFYTGLWKFLPESVFMLGMSFFLTVSMLNEVYLAFMERFIAKHGSNMQIYGGPAQKLYNGLKNIRVFHVVMAMTIFYAGKISF